MREAQILQILKQELAPAVGCTEPVAIAYAAAKARAVLGKMPDRAIVYVSRNILKNAMGVGIPGTDEIGLEMAAAMGIIGGNSDAVLEVLGGITKQEMEQAKVYAAEKVVTKLKDTPKKLYIEVILEAKDDSAVVVIEDSHTNITRIAHGNKLVFEQGGCSEIKQSSGDTSMLSVADIYEFVCSVDIEKLKFLQECIAMNKAISDEGLRGGYGLKVGKNIYESIKQCSPKEDIVHYAIALTAAAADARMAGSTMPVMTICGSGNQGITATLPIIAAADARGEKVEMLYRALALGCLITIHVKHYIGKLSPLCGCGMGSSIGVCCALTYMQGGGLKQIENAINNMIADVSGIICDGAKSGCALKIATVISSAFHCSLLAVKNSSVSDHDGIVACDVEDTIRNLGKLGNAGMADTDRVILDMMVCR